jgi:transposase, IS30 family
MRKQRVELSLYERQLIYKMHIQGIGYRAIGKHIKRDHSVIHREVSRNKPPGLLAKAYNCYERARYSDDKAKERRKRPGNTYRLKNIFIRQYVEEKLEAKWTPERISGRLPIDHPGYQICTESIYQWLDTDARDLRKHLPNFGKRKKTRKGRYVYHQKKDSAKRPIEERPKEVQRRERFGDWEGDTVLSKRSSTACVYTLKERLTRAVFFEPLASCTMQETQQKAFRLFNNLPAYARQTLTHDNGPENNFHAHIEKAIPDLKVYFAVPYAAHQRGAVENANGYLRRIFPKGTDFATVSREQLLEASRWHNNLPMKCLKFRTPKEAFFAELAVRNEKPHPEILIYF